MQKRQNNKKTEGQNNKKGPSEIWSDKLKLLHIRHTESQRGRRRAICYGGADGTKSDGDVAYRFLITILE